MLSQQRKLDHLMQDDSQEFEADIERVRASREASETEEIAVKQTKVTVDDHRERIENKISFRQ